MTRAFVLTTLSFMESSCTHLFFQPSTRLLMKPESFGARYETVKFQSQDGTVLTGIFFPAARPPAKATVVHFHGNGENMTSHFTFVYWLADWGFNVFVFDYRGYGASGGVPSVKGAVEDGIAALQYVRTRADVNSNRIVTFGQSLGGSLAVASLALGGDLGVRAVILEGSFASYKSIAKEKLAERLWTWIVWPFTGFLISDAYSPLKFIGRLPQCPLLFIHGDQDQIVPYKEGLRLFKKAREPKEFWTVPKGRHLETFVRPGSEYRSKLASFLFGVLGNEAP